LAETERRVASVDWRLTSLPSSVASSASCAAVRLDRPLSTSTCAWVVLTWSWVAFQVRFDRYLELGLEPWTAGEAAMSCVANALAMAAARAGSPSWAMILRSVLSSGASARNLSEELI